MYFTCHIFRIYVCVFVCIYICARARVCVYTTSKYDLNKYLQKEEEGQEEEREERNYVNLKEKKRRFTFHR